MTPTHRLPQATFAELAGGGGGPEAVALLRRAGRSRHKLLLGRILTGPCAPAAESGARLLAAVERACPEQARRVLDNPSFGIWAVRAVRGCPAHSGGSEAGCLGAQLAALVAVAAIRCGITARIRVPVTGGLVRLPGLGTAELGGPRAAEAELRFADGRVELTASGVTSRLPRDLGTRCSGWVPVTLLEADHNGLRIRIPLETADPHLLALEAGKVQVGAWAERLRDAWRLLADRHPERAGALAAGLTAIVPLPSPAHGVATATSRHAFGAVLASWPGDAERLAVSLLHEFQHSKLGALMDLCRLHDPADRGRYHAPWRPDPRPLGGLLHGVYAHLADLAFWRETGRSSRGAEGVDAVWKHSVMLRQVECGLEELEVAAGLTGPGRQFTGYVAAAVRGERASAPGSAAVHRAAARVQVGRETAWRLRWARPDPEGVARLVAAWGAGEPPGEVPSSALVVPESPVTGEKPAVVAWFARQRGAVDAVAPDPGSAASAVMADPGRSELWARLAVAAAGHGLPAAGPLTARTELVRAVMAGTGVPDPLLIAGWLAGAGGQKTGVSMSQNARSPRARSATTG